ncbi:MAG: phosphoglycerate dehydrogenase, partial [Marmoricola sp.]|nr:phosphoglycerate dehydrogenase [Marmoricola sp.]
LARPGLILVDTSRGGIVDDRALHDALVSGQVAAAGLDLLDVDPPTDTALLGLPTVVATPHLGAATHEAQEKAGLAVARSVRLALAGELVPDAVNVRGGVVADVVRPGIALAAKLGRIFTALAGGAAVGVDVEVRGEITDHDVQVIELAALQGLFTDLVEGAVTFVNAPHLAAERGTEVRLVTDPESPDHRNLVTLRGLLPDGSRVSVSGTLVGIAQRERLVEVDGFVVDLEPTEHLAFLRYPDRPGMVGILGGVLGRAGVNIAGMQVSRNERGGEALVAHAVDSAVTPTTLEEVRTTMGATSVRAVDLTPAED